MSTVGPIRVLVVCTGNVCRSAAAHLLLAQRLGDLVEVSSAGTGALLNHPVDPRMAPLLEADGVTTDGFSSRQITVDQVEQADLVLTATTDHRSQVVELAPMKLRRAFTLLEFAALLPMVDHPAPSGLAPRDYLTSMLGGLVEARSMARLTSDQLDIADPYRGSAEDFDLCYAQLRDAVDAVVHQVDQIRAR